MDNRRSKLEKFTKISSIERLKKEFRFESVGKIGIINLISQIELNWLANKSSLSDILRVELFKCCIWLNALFGFSNLDQKK